MHSITHLSFIEPLLCARWKNLLTLIFINFICMVAQTVSIGYIYISNIRTYILTCSYEWKLILISLERITSLKLWGEKQVYFSTSLFILSSLGNDQWDNFKYFTSVTYPRVVVAYTKSIQPLPETTEDKQGIHSYLSAACFWFWLFFCFKGFWPLAPTSRTLGYTY